jgi:hypothetical protein
MYVTIPQCETVLFGFHFGISPSTIFFLGQNFWTKKKNIINALLQERILQLGAKFALLGFTSAKLFTFDYDSVAEFVDWIFDYDSVGGFGLRWLFTCCDGWFGLLAVIIAL